MRTLLLIAFWIAVTGTVVRLGYLSVDEYPRTRKIPRGEDIVAIFIALVWMFFLSRTLWEWI